MGNPLNDGTWTYTWEHGRQLAQMSAEKLDGNKDISITYTYDADGMRTGKTVTTKNYTLLTHVYSRTLKNPTCTKQGYTLYQCDCGLSYKDDWVPALGHLYLGNSNICHRCGYDRSWDFVYPGPVKPPVETDSVGTEYAISAHPGNQDLGNVEITELVLQSTVVETYSYVYTGSRLTQETVTTVTTTDEGTETTTDILDYFYGVNGPTMVTWNGTDYYYLTNAQGNIVALLDESGNSAVQYTYDAWGYPLSTTGSMADTLGSRNSLRYRGYVFDTETGLYYLQSRYFNPKMARFINADGVISEVGGPLQGYNMFAYCFNNPVNMIDEAGSWPSWEDIWGDIKEGVQEAADWIDDNVVRPVVDLGKDIVEDFNNYDTSNTSEKVVFSSNFFSNYKGVFVLKIPFDASFSFGIIGLSHLQQNADSLNHEYGHTIQMDNMGVIGYSTNVAGPSLTINILERLGKLPYDYFSYPWEAEANKLGGSSLSQGYKPSLPPGGYSSYWDLIQLFFE